MKPDLTAVREMLLDAFRSSLIRDGQYVEIADGTIQVGAVGRQPLIRFDAEKLAATVAAFFADAQQEPAPQNDD